MEDKISVIIPVYNVEPYLERCLDSIIHNTYRNLEIICVDDGSPDNCGAILDRYAERDDRIVVIHKENGGLSSARNSGMDVATGEYIAFIDSDDWIHPQYFEILMYVLKQKNSDLTICSFGKPKELEEFEFFKLEDIKSRELNLEGIYKVWDAKTYACGKLYRKGLIEGNRFIENVRIAEDAAFNALTFGKYEAVKASYIPLPLYSYFVRPGSLAGGLKEPQTLALGEILYSYADQVSGLRAKRIYIQEALKRGLSSRYGFSLRKEEEQNRQRSNRLVYKTVRELRQLPNVSLKEKVQYSVFAYLPVAYRLFRILDDPTLLTMERNIRRNRR